MDINKKPTTKNEVGFLNWCKNYSATTSNVTVAATSLYKRTFAV